MLQFLLMLLGLAFPSNHNIATTSNDNSPISVQSTETESDGDSGDDTGGEKGQVPPKK
ncbi:hypothetical protein SAMN05443634_10252 [Chishuiella changwenlii]|uniref:Uncharacterized protein n=1 Tax=Chishuiella changwenlii TaxID=1434701 RepID=A0A1M6TQW3_9FLAO|nr:hypothetical protein [Chishuiella changwenlii]GGF04024.1 hypothetical protein GCM10010984_21690 [Chishuiella changwenlii]SHK59334.1 hypothetical protein SAMN05443634_10252 [Chishuiella changwenlii]